MQIQKGLVKYKDRTDIVCTYGLTEEGKQYYFLDNTSMTNGNIIASTVLVEAIDPVVVASSIGIIDKNGKEIIPFDNKSIKVIGDNLLLVEIVNSVTPSVVEANSRRSDPLSATKLVTTSAAIKDKFNSKMGSDGRFVFNDQFSEATVCDFDGNNIIDNQYFSFIAIKNDRLYFSKNTADSPVLEYSLTDHMFITEDDSKLDVQNTSITQETIDVAMGADENVSNFVANDITAKDFENVMSEGEEEPLPVEPNVVENPEENVTSNSEEIEMPLEQPENDSVNDVVEEPLPVVPEEHFVSDEQVEQDDAINETASVDADVENSEIDSVQVVEDSSFVVESPAEQVDEDVVENVNVEDNMMAFDFKDNIDYSNVNVDTYSSDVISDNTITEFSDDLFTSDLDTDIFADSTLHVDKIDIDDNFNSLSYDVRGKDSIIEDVASTMSNLISLNRSQKQTIAEYEEKLESAVSSYKKVVEKARIQIRDVETLKSRLKNYETIVTKLEAKIHLLENKVHDQERIISSQSHELDSLRPQVKGKEELVRILADAQNLLEQNI